MSIIKQHKKIQSMQEKWLTLDAHAILDSFLSNGYMSNPSMLGFSSFEHAAFDDDKFEFAGDLQDFHFYENEVYFSNGLNKIGAVCKSYFYREKFKTNAFYLFGNVRLLPLMKSFSLFNVACSGNIVLPVEKTRVRLFLSADCYEGALFFENGVLLQFSTKSNDSRNYFVRTIEGGVDVSNTIDLKAANGTLVARLYSEIVNVEALINIRPRCFAFFKLQAALKKKIK